MKNFPAQSTPASSEQHDSPLGTALTLDFVSWPDYKPTDGMPWNDSYVYTPIYLKNTANLDLKNLKMTIESDVPFGRIRELSGLGARLAPAPPMLLGPISFTVVDNDGHSQTHAALPGGDDPNNGRFVTNTYRIYVDRLTSGDIPQVLIAATVIDGRIPGLGFRIGPHGVIEGTPTAPHYIRLFGSFEVPVAPGKADMTIHNFDLSKGARPADWKPFELKF
jgi:hypothetical protein